MSRGIQQGCPISALFYLYVTEILAIKINTKNIVKGISINKNDIKTYNMQMAQLVFLNDEASSKHALDTIHDFCEHEG